MVENEWTMSSDSSSKDFELKFRRLHALFQVLICSWYFIILSPLIFLTTLQGGFVGAKEMTWASLMTQTVKKICLQCKKPSLYPWVGKIP